MEIAVQEEFAERLAALERVFDMHLLEGRGEEEGEIACYYEQSRWAYRIFHSNDGAMHLALNPDGVFDKAGYHGQAREVERLIGPATERVLELAAGKGFNLRYLAERHPRTSFTGVDLIARHVDMARTKTKDLENVRFVVGDFHRLEFEAESFDVAFVVESLCHATDLHRALHEARRVLRPGGLFVVGWSDVEGRRPVPLATVESLKRFTPTTLPPFLSPVFQTFSHHRHQFEFYARPER